MLQGFAEKLVVSTESEDRVPVGMRSLLALVEEVLGKVEEAVMLAELPRVDVPLQSVRSPPRRRSRGGRGGFGGLRPAVARYPAPTRPEIVFHSSLSRNT